MSFVLRATRVVASRHLDVMLSAYADRNLPSATLLACDRHVAICPGCRDAVDAERRLLRSLRTAVAPELSSRLESALLNLAVSGSAGTPARGRSPLAVVGPSAPAMHRSPVRAAMLASLAAGASAAAAWSVGMGASQPLARVPSPAAVASSSSATAPSRQAASFLSTSAMVSGTPGSDESTTTVRAPLITVVPVAGSWAGVRMATVLGTIEP